jgi:hypothetical protein
VLKIVREYLFPTVTAFVYSWHAETLSSSVVGARGFERVFKMRRSTFNYICSLVRLPCLEDMMARDHTFNDGRVLSLQDRVAVALITLNSGEPLKTVGSTIGVNESTISLVTKMFLEAMTKLTNHHFEWPSSSGKEKIKSKFDKIHGLPNCCGVLHAALITFVSAKPDSDHAEDDSILLQAVVDPHMRFISCWLASEGMKNQSKSLQESNLFKGCETGIHFNGSKLKVSSGLEIGEYIIGDAGYSLLPWLITPYQEEDLSYYKVEFNRRHSAATTVAVRALATLKDTWRFLHGQAWRPQNMKELRKAVFVCCRLHNLVIDMEEGFLPTANLMYPLRKVSDEDAASVRGILSEHLTSRLSESGGKSTQLLLYDPSASLSL